MSIKFRAGREQSSPVPPHQPNSGERSPADSDLQALAKVHGFMHAVTDPAPLVAMAAAGPAFSLVRNPVMSFLLRKPAGLFTRGLGLRMASAAAGLPGEVAVFAATDRAVRHALNPDSLDWRPEVLAQEAGGLGLALALFKMHGRAAQVLLPKHLQNWRPAAAGLGMYSGIVHSHLWEEKLGWRERSSWDVLMTHSLEMFLQLKGMGHLTQRLMGPRYGAWVASLEARAEQEIQRAQDRDIRGAGFLGIPNLLPMQVVTPEGLTLNPPGDFLVKMSGPPEGESGRPGPGASEPDPYEASRLRSGLQSVIDMFDQQREPSARKKLSKDIIEHENVAMEILSEKFKIMGIAARDIPKRVEGYLQEVRRVHFEGLNHKNFQMADRLDFLVAQLRKDFRQARGEEKNNLRTLLDSAEIKQWEVVRVYGEGQAILANSQGSKGDTEFSAQNYPMHRRHFEDFYIKVRDFISRNPQFERILDAYSEKGTLAASEPLQPEDLHPLIDKLDISPEFRGIFRDALEFDPFLGADDFMRLYRVLSLLEKGPEPGTYLEHFKPLAEYLAALKGARPWLVRSDLADILDEAHLNPSVDSPRNLMAIRAPLAKKIHERLKSSDVLVELTEAEHVLEHYFEKLPGLLELLYPYRPVDAALPALKWEEVKGRLRERVKLGMVHPEVEDQLLRWIEGSPDHPPDTILANYRSEFLAGILEFFFNETRFIREQERYSDLLVEICSRKDLAMMRSLAVRFHNYHRGMETRSRYLMKPEKAATGESGNKSDRHGTLRAALLETARIYLAFPQFQGPYFEILEKAMDRSQPHSARLNAPIHLRIQGLLQGGQGVKLLSHPSLGVELVRTGPEEGAQRLEVISSIQENLERKASFLGWARKITREVESGFQEPYRISLYVPRIRSEWVREEILTWARDFLEQTPLLDEINLYLPVPARGKAVADLLDASQYVQLVVNRALSTTEEKIRILKRELEQGSHDVGDYLGLYQLLRNSEAMVTLESDAFQILLEARRRFPDNKTVAREMWRVLEENYQFIRYLGHNQLSDFDSFDRSKTQDNLHFLERMAQNPRQIQLLRVQKSIERYEVRRMSTPASQGDNDAREMRNLLFQTVDLAIEGAPREPLPREGFIKTMDQKDLSLGGKDHYQRIGLFMEAILGQPFPDSDLKRVFDLSPLGYETHQWHIAYDLKNPNRFTLRASIIPMEGGQAPYRRKGAFQETAPATALEGGLLTLHVEGISNRGETRLVVQQLRMPESHHGNGVGTLLTERLITLGQRLGARYLVLRGAENSGKYALLKMGGRIPKELWKTVQQRYAQFVDRQIEENNLWGFDTSAVASLRNGQELAYSYLDPLLRRLNTQPRWEKGEGISDVFWVDPAVESRFQLGRQFFLQEKNFSDWDIIFDLRRDSPAMKFFWKYYQHRFGLGEGEILNPIDANDMNVVHPFED